MVLERNGAEDPSRRWKNADLFEKIDQILSDKDTPLLFDVVAWNKENKEAVHICRLDGRTTKVSDVRLSQVSNREDDCFYLVMAKVDCAPMHAQFLSI